MIAFENVGEFKKKTHMEMIHWSLRKRSNNIFKQSKCKNFNNGKIYLVLMQLHLFIYLV
jgi:pterin-4a-carbinolamine dehydratase